MATAQRVNFPFDAALPAAQALWALAQKVREGEPVRQAAGRSALTEFKGAYADRFRQMLQVSATSAGATAQDLEQAAYDIAKAWADAQHQQQIYLYFAMVKEKRDNRSILQDATDWLTGDHTNYGSQPGPPEVPSPPGFAPTYVPPAEVPGQAPVPIG